MEMKQQILMNFLREEDGQTTTEYVLILAVILTIIMQFKKKILVMIGKIFDILDDKTNTIADEM